MMIYPSMPMLLEKVNSRYLLVNVIAQRAREISIEAELSDTVDKLYKKLVPADVREYIEEKDELVKQKPVSKK